MDTRYINEKKVWYTKKKWERKRKREIDIIYRCILNRAWDKIAT